MVAEGSLWEAAIIKLLPLCRKHSIKVRNQKGDVVFCYSSMSVASAEGSRWETAAAILMLRHSMKSVNVVLCSRLKTMWVWAREGNGMTGRSSSEVAPRTSPGRRTGARKQKRSFLLEGARDARAGWQQLGGGTEAVFSTKTQNGGHNN